ncbi:hypothetical protein CYY_008609 [Polysphondylium violaceum]|uniref:Pleckstrin domain-containing protein n=1 Tax=Polysphondylium violaceum TaxID=133409 RepID=A0A8J4PP17_9MYCE|nr:hypothetical protein CYY_008609 [Polysphondylium violaceum]
MDRYEAKSNQLISLMSQLSDSRAKTALQKICQDLINIDKSSIENDITAAAAAASSKTTTTTNGSVGGSTSSSSLSTSTQNLTDTNAIATTPPTTPASTTTPILNSHNNREMAHLIDLCFDHIKKSLLIPEPSIIWKIIAYSISELDYLDRSLDIQQNKPEKEKVSSSYSARLEEVSSMLAFLHSSPKNNTREYAELLSGINAHMKKITLRLKGVAEQNQYSSAKKYGWVEKRCGKNQSFRTWKRMWFVLGENEISYFIKDKTVKKKTAAANNEDLLWSNECIINLEGELGKKKEGKGWKIRYMKLLDHTLVYYKNQREREPLGIINLNDCQDCEVFKENSNKFVVVHSNNRYFFQTTTKEELSKWINSIRARIPSLNTKSNQTKKMDLSQFYLKGAIELGRILSITETFKFSGQPHSISIATEEKHYYFSFDSNREKQEWLTTFNNELSKLNSSQVIKHTTKSSNSGSNSNTPNLSSTNSSNWTSSPIQSAKSSASRSSLSLSRQKIENKLPSLSSTSSLASSNNEEEGSEFGSVLARKPTLAQIKYTTSSTNLLKHSNGSIGSLNNLSQNNNNNSSTSSLSNMINSNPIDTDQEDSGDDDLKMMIPESLKNEMVKRSALNLLETFKLEVFLSINTPNSNSSTPSLSSSPSQSSTSPPEMVTFLFSNHVLVDQVKTFIFKKIPALLGLQPSEYRLGIDEENLFEIEFLKFIYSHTMVELTIKTCGIIRVGVFHHRKERRVKEKLYPDKYQPLCNNSNNNNGLTNSSGVLPILNNNSKSNNNNIQQSPPDKSIPTNSPLANTRGHSQSVSSNNSGWVPSGASSPASQGSPLLEKKGWQSSAPSPTTCSRRLMISPCSGWNVELPGNNEFNSNGFIPKFNKQEQGFYRRYIFESQGCVSSFLGVDTKIGPMAFSLVKDLMDNYRGVLHTKSGAKTVSEESKNINFSTNILGVSKKMKTKKIVSHMMNLLEPNVDAKLLSLASNQSDLQKELLLLEERQTTSGFKFGLVYCRHGQITDDEIFSNKTGNKDWEEFLDLLGDRIELIGWPHYSAGLDVRNNTTGTHSLYTDYHGNEVMFHVSTMLPFSPADHQQIERKRQIGNDICVVVFNDGNLSYSPSTITSHFNHVVIVVQLDKQNNGYKISMACKDGVKIPFEPVTPNGGLVKKNDLKDFLLTKLINGELASLQAPVFSSKISRTRESLLNYYVEQFL